MFTANDVMTLRAQTGAGMMDCKKALTECNGDMEKATTWLREKGMAAAAKRQEELLRKVLLVPIFIWVEKLAFCLKLTVKQTLLQNQMPL